MTALAAGLQGQLALRLVWSDQTRRMANSACLKTQHLLLWAPVAVRLRLNSLCCGAVGRALQQSS
jgi:hypothetical protein